MKQPIDFFTKAKQIGIRLFRNQPPCECRCCLNDLRLGIIPTTDDDVNRLFKEQELGVEFSTTQYDYSDIIFIEIKPKEKSKKIKAIQHNKNKKLFKK
jgi:hypothetical protein